MQEQLSLAVWPKPDDCALALRKIENCLLNRLVPPLNLKDVLTPWTTQVKAARKGMADQARNWVERP